jgi:SAM-dependent methyltransferase
LPSLLLGAGHSREKKVWLAEKGREWVQPLVTLDMGTDCGADVIWDLENRPLPFPDEHFDELAAYDVLEHIGRQGDWRGWFEEFSEYWRVLKPGGVFGIIVPIGEDRFADPGHTRFLQRNHFGFLSQEFYRYNLARGTAMTDYRWFWKKNFNIIFLQEQEGHHLALMLQKA